MWSSLASRETIQMEYSHVSHDSCEVWIRGCGRFLGDSHAAIPWLCLYCTGLIQPSDCLMRSWSYQWMYSSIRTSTSSRVRSMALTLRYPYPPLEAANAPATRTRSPAYLSMTSLAWWQ